MRLNEILTESQDLEEGPLDAIGRGAAKVVGGVAKGAGMIGGIAGGVKKAYQKGKAISTARIAGEEPPEQTQTAPQQAPADPYAAKQTAPATGAAPTAADVNAQGPKGTAPAKQQTGAAGQAVAKTSAALSNQDADKAGQTMYAQVKANVNKLDKKGKQRIMQLLQKSLAQPAAPSGAIGAMAQQVGGAKPANTMANAPVSKTNVAKPGNPNAAPADDNTPTSAEQSAADARVAAAGGSPEEVAKQRATREKRVAARNKPVKVAGKTPATAPAANVQNASKINSGNIIAEGFTFYRKK
jgi:hypothetical protein